MFDHLLTDLIQSQVKFSVKQTHVNIRKLSVRSIVQ